MVKRRRTLKGSGDYSFSLPGVGSYTYKGATPFASAGRIIGDKFGWGKTGEGIGHAVGRLFGSGDYKMGRTPGYNSIWNSTQTPKFASRGRGNIITNREYIGDIFTSATGAFDITSYKIQPGLASTFPWLSTLAQNYEQYKIHGMIFEFKSTLGDNSGVQNVGTVIMGTEYNVSTADYANKQVMENSEFAQSAKSVASQIHGIECASREQPMKMLYVRTGKLPAANISAGDNLKWYDFANFQIATTGFPAIVQNIGELWVSYQIEFFKPQIPANIGGAVQSLHVSRTVASAAAYLGTTLNYVAGSLSAVFPNNNSITISGFYISNSYMLIVNWDGAAAATSNVTVAITGGTATATNKLILGAGGSALKTYGTPGAAVGTMSLEWAFTCLKHDVTFTFSAGTIPTNALCDIYIVPIDNGLI